MVQEPVLPDVTTRTADSTATPIAHQGGRPRRPVPKRAGDRYSKRTLPGVVMRRSSGSVTVMTPNATARPMPIRA